MGNKCVFLYKDNSKNEDRDCVFYIEKNPLWFTDNSCFSGIHLHGACFSVSFDYAKPVYDNIETILTRDEFQALIDFDKAARSIETSIKKYAREVQLCNDIRPIFKKLLSQENDKLFEKIIEEERKYLSNKYELDDNDIDEIFDYYYLEYRDRGVISAVFDSIDEAAYEEAHSLGYANNNNDRWFDYELFGEDLIESCQYLELSDGRVVYLNF